MLRVVVLLLTVLVGVLLHRSSQISDRVDAAVCSVNAIHQSLSGTLVPLAVKLL